MADNALIYLALREIYEQHAPAGATILCKRLNISQATAGRLLSDMENLGLVEKVSNKGRILSAKGIEQLKLHDITNQKDQIAKELVSISLDDGKRTLLEIMEIRKLLECQTAKLAPGHATEEDICELENYAIAHRYNLAQDKPADEQDLSFHLCIARISQNYTISKILGLLLTGGNAYVKFSEAGVTDKDLQVKFHLKILNAIKAKKPVLASQAMNDHLNQIIHDVNEFYK